MLGNGNKARIGSVSSKWGHFHEWKRLAEQEPGVVDMETLLKGVCSKQNFMDLLENFIVFDDSSGGLVKIVARNHQFLGATLAAVVVSEEQGEVDKFRRWDLDITPHRKLIKQGFELEDGIRIDLEEAFKKEGHPFRVAIVCAMWLTGFDVPSLSTLYLDKPLKAHTLMQAIARANRINEGKNNGLIVDYCGILKNLRKALATFAGTADGGHGGEDGDVERNPAKRTTVQNLKQAIEKKLLRLLAQNPLRTDFQKHYEEVVAEYNREKEQLTIEKTFEALLKLVDALDEEERRAMREGLDEESLALFDLLKKPDLKATDIRKIKKVAAELLATLKAEKLKIDHWRDKESTRDAVRTAIRDFLWSDKTGLPVNSYTEDEVGVKAEDVFRHVYRAYPTVPSPLYPAAI